MDWMIDDQTNIQLKTRSWHVWWLEGLLTVMDGYVCSKWPTHECNAGQDFCHNMSTGIYHFLQSLYKKTGTKEKQTDILSSNVSIFITWHHMIAHSVASGMLTAQVKQRQISESDFYAGTCRGMLAARSFPDQQICRPWGRFSFAPVSNVVVDGMSSRRPGPEIEEKYGRVPRRDYFPRQRAVLLYFRFMRNHINTISNDWISGITTIM